MKQAGEGTRIIRDNDGNPWGLFLAGGGWAEHESKIDRIRWALHVPEDGFLLEGRTMTEPYAFARAKGQVTRTYYEPGKKAKKQTDKVSYLALRERDLEPANRKWLVDRYNLDVDITAAWDEKNFKVAAWTPEAAQFLDEVEAAASAGRIAVWAGNSRDQIKDPFSHMGLIIALVDKMPQAAIDAVNDSDVETKKLKSAAEATGILAKLEKANGQLGDNWSSQPYHALAPAWIGNFRRGEDEMLLKDQTKHQIKFFLNPRNQQSYKAGWYTVEELELWIEGKGPVIKAKAA